jgi:hypothetical protein
MVVKPPLQPSSNRLAWLPFVCAGLGLLFGGGMAFYLVCLGIRSGEYDNYAYFGGLGKALQDLVGYPILGAFIGLIAGFGLGKAIVHTVTRAR